MSMKSIEIDGDLYQVKEVTMGVMKHILPRLGKDNAVDAHLDMMKACVFCDGRPLGDAVEDLGLTTYMKLMPVVMEVNGMNEGKDSTPTS